MLKNIKFIILLVVFLQISIAESHSTLTEETTYPQLHELFKREWQARLQRNPMQATRMGQKESNHLLQDVSEAAHVQWKKQTEGYLAELKQIDFMALSDFDQVNYQIFQAQLERRLSEVDFKSYQIPFLSDWGFHTDILRLDKQVPLKNEQDYQNYLARMAAIPAYFEQHISNMRKGLKRNFTMPVVVMNGFSDVIKTGFQPDSKKHPLWRPFKKMPDSIPQEGQKHLQAKAKKLLEKQVKPAFEQLYHFFEKEYIPTARKSLGASQLPDGKAYYAAQIKHYTTLDLSAEEIHRIGLSEVARIRAEMLHVIAKTGFKGDFKAFLRFLRESPEFYAKSEEELLKHASYIAKKMDGQLPKFFSRLPRQPYTLEAVPAAIAPKYTTGRYVPAPIDSEKPGTYWVNTYALNRRPLYVLEALTLHEAVPGHHLQGALNQELTNLPEFRRHSYISAFGEGWALYCERLGIEAGFYQDPYSDFGRLSYEMWRAARLVIDTGLHAMGWSREQAIALLEENSGLSKHNIQTEVDRYISWPGQALSYKLGELQIVKLRKQAERRLGDKFDIRKFHDEILKNGSIPIDVLNSQMLKFIAREELAKK